jgi:flagellar FliL protein
MTTPDAKDNKPAEISLMMTGVVLAVLSALAGGGGWFLGMTAGGSVLQSRGAMTQAAGSYSELLELEQEGKAKEEADQNRLEQNESAPELVTLLPITTNLYYPSDSWVRLEIALVFEKDPDLKLAHLIHQDLLSYMRTVSLQQIEGARGFQHLRDDLTERAAIRSDGRVSNLIFRTFLIE